MEEKEGKVKVKIQGREYWFDKEDVKKEGKQHYIKGYNKYKITLTILGVENEEKTFYYLYVDEGGNILEISFEPDEKLTFNIEGIKNKNKKVDRIHFNENGNVCALFLEYCDIITFKIKNIEYNIKVVIISFNQDGTLTSLTGCEQYEGDFFYEGKKYNLTFNDRETISFKPNGELDESCIKNSVERYNKIFVADRLNNIEEERKVIDKVDIVLIVLYLAVSLALFCGVIFWHPTFPDCIIFKQDKYKFLYEIFRKSPTIIIAIVGFRFIQLAFERIKIIGEVEKVKKFIELTKDENIKNKLLEKIAIPFFSPKKIKNVFFEKLTDDILIDNKNKIKPKIPS